MDQNIFLLRYFRSNNGSSANFWSINDSYTTNISLARRFSREAAVNQYKSRCTDIPIRFDFVSPFQYLAIDFVDTLAHYI